MDGSYLSVFFWENVNWSEKISGRLSMPSSDQLLTAMQMMSAARQLEIIWRHILTNFLINGV
jgi:hypothetical protein